MKGQVFRVLIGSILVVGLGYFYVSNVEQKTDNIKKLQYECGLREEKQKLIDSFVGIQMLEYQEHICTGKETQNKSLKKSFDKIRNIDAKLSSGTMFDPSHCGGVNYYQKNICPDF